MTSKSSFWVSIKQNQKRRIWVWISAFLIQMITCLGTLTVYISRINRWNEDGAYLTQSAYKQALYEATRDALSFNMFQWAVVAFMATMIGMQGFSYLYDRRKVDLYHSVPVSRKSRFWIVYAGGVGIYLITALLPLVLGVAMAAAMGAVNGMVIVATALAFLLNFLFFMVLYHVMILSVMLTGNWFVTILVYLFINVYEPGIYMILENFKSSFFRTASSFYVVQEPKISAVFDYVNNLYQFKYASGELTKITKMALPYCGKWFVLAIVLLVAAYYLYSKRASEMAGKAIAFRKVQPVIKVAVVVPVASMIGMFVYQASYSSRSLMAVSMVVSGLLCCGILEILFAFELRSAIKHLVSTSVAFIGILAVFFIFDQDLLGYDKYVPRADQVESIALQIDCEYNDFYEETDYGMEYVGVGEYQKENMKIMDVEPVLALAERSIQEEDWDNMKEGHYVNVLYRMKSGREIGRCFNVDFENPVNESYLNQIVGSKAFKEGNYETMTQDKIYDKVSMITYSNGVTQVAVPAGDVQKIRELWNEDMLKADYTMLREHYPCGSLVFTFNASYFTVTLPVYDTFTNVLAYLKQEGAYYPVQLNAKDIESITITNYHNEVYEVQESADGEEAEAAEVIDDVYYEDVSVQAEFRDEQEIAEILKNSYPAYSMNTAWNGYEAFDDNYDINIVFKADTTYPYQRGGYYFSYQFFSGKVPGFVVQATALGQE